MTGPEHIREARRAWTKARESHYPQDREVARQEALFHATMAAAFAPIDVAAGRRAAEWYTAAEGAS